LRITFPLIDRASLKKLEAPAEAEPLATEPIALEMRFLESDCLPDLLKLQDLIADGLPCPEIFVLHDERYFQEIMQRERSIIGISSQYRLAAYSIIRIPGIPPDGSDGNLGRDINLPDEDLMAVAHLQAIAVHPACRGLGLQRKLARAHLQVIEDMGYRHVCCTVSPKNAVSLANMLSCGFQIEGLRPKFNSWYRYILHKKFSQTDPSPGIKAEASRQEVCIPISDLDRQADLLKRGFKGLTVKFRGQASEVVYVK
jgi:ribosomal protein S18 acetylase RimI-like enzyme